MLAILCLLLLLTFVGSEIDRHNHANPNLFKITLYVIMAVLIGFRIDVGVDYDVYVYVYEHPNGWRLQVMEPIWRQIIIFLRQYTRHPQLFFVCVAAYTFFCLYKGTRKLSSEFYLTTFFLILLGFYGETANTVRQCAAMATLYWGYYYLTQKKWLPFILLCSIAVMLHYSAIFGLFLIIVSLVRINRWVLSCMLVASIILGPFVMDFLYGRFMPIMKAMDLYSYDTDQFDAGISSGLLQGVYALLGLFLIFGTYRKIGYRNLKVRSMLNMIIYGLCVYNIFYTFQPARRLYTYGFIFVIILLPILLEKFTPKTRYLLIATISIIFFAWLAKSTWEYPYELDFLMF